MVVEHEVREHSRDGGDTHVDEYSRGEGKKVGRFSGAFRGVSNRFAEMRAERAEAKDEADLALSREEYLREQERLEERRMGDEERAYALTHRAPLRERASSAARRGYALYQESRKPARRTGTRRRSAERPPPGYTVYKGKLYRIPKGAAPAPRRRRKATRRDSGEIFPDTAIYR